MLLGELLIAQGLATLDDIKIGLSRQDRRGGRLGENLVALGIITKEILEAALREQYERAKAILVHEDLLAKSIQSHGDDHPKTHRQRSELAFAMIAGGRYADGLNLARTALAGHEAAFGGEHYWTIDSEQAVNDALAALERAEALRDLTAPSPGKRPAVAPGIGARQQHPVGRSANNLNTARSVEVADRFDWVATTA